MFIIIIITTTIKKRGLLAIIIIIIKTKLQEIEIIINIAIIFNMHSTVFSPHYFQTIIKAFIYVDESLMLNLVLILQIIMQF